MRALTTIPLRGGGQVKEGEEIPEGAATESELTSWGILGWVDNGKPKKKVQKSKGSDSDPATDKQ